MGPRAMTLDLLMLGNEPTLVLVERAKLAEVSGYDTVWLEDERFYREVYACLALFAANTTRVRLGPSGWVRGIPAAWDQ